MIDPTSCMNTSERRSLRALAAETGLDPEEIAAEMAAAYLRLVLDAPRALPASPLTALIARARGKRNA